jgi:ribosomal protein L13
MSKVIEKKGFSEVFKLAIYGMLPSNKLRDKAMKNLTISE